MRVEIDRHSGFCGGVIRAIRRAESFLAENPGKGLFSLGAIVHNGAELARLRDAGLTVIDYDDLENATDARGRALLIRAHGEPPERYRLAQEKGFETIDCTCPVVLDLQKSIREAAERLAAEGLGGGILIFGQRGHAEVLGLVGQVGNPITVVSDTKMLAEAIREGDVDLSKPLEVFAQTTASPSGYAALCEAIEDEMAGTAGMDIQDFRAMDFLRIHDTICTQVAMRHSRLGDFAASHDVIVFVSGKESSNGKILYSLCKSANIRTYRIESPAELRPEWFNPEEKVGICGATSTPRWLLERVADEIIKLFGTGAASRK